MKLASPPGRRQFLVGLGTGAFSAAGLARASDRWPILVAEQANRDFVLPLLKLIAEGGGFEWQPVFVPWARLLSASANGEAVAWGVSRNAERDAIFNFSDQVFSNHVWLVETPAQASAGVASLDGRTLCKRRGFSLGAVLDAGAGKSFQVVEADLGYEAVLRMLLAGRCDGVFLTHRSADAAVVEQRLGVLLPPANRFVVRRPFLSEGGIYFAAAKSRPELTAQLQRVNAGLHAQARAIQAVVASTA